MRQRASEQRNNQLYNEADKTEPDMPYADTYPPRRREQRLSYSFWSVIRDKETLLQPLLELASTSDRLRAVLLQLRDVAKRLQD